MRRSPVRFFFLALTLLPLAARAQVPATGGHAKALDPANPYSASVNAMRTDLEKTLTDRQKAALAMIQVSFGNMGAVRIAEQSVSRAVDSCDARNPALKPAMDDRFAAWKQTVGPALGAQDENLKRSVHSGIAGDPKKIQAYLNAIDNAALYGAKHENYPSASTEGACKNLVASMDRTKDVMAQLLAAQTWPSAGTLKIPEPAAVPDAPPPAAPQ